MYCPKCGIALEWRDIKDLGYNINRGNREILERRVCPIAEKMNIFKRVVTGHYKYPELNGHEFNTKIVEPPTCIK